MSSFALKTAWTFAAVSAAFAVGAWVLSNDPVRAADLTLLRETSVEADRLDADNTRLALLVPKDAELTSLRRTNAEMLRLRTETMQIRGEIAALQRSTNAPVAGNPELAEVTAENQRLRGQALALTTRPDGTQANPGGVTPVLAVRPLGSASPALGMADMVRRLSAQGADQKTIGAVLTGMRNYQAQNPGSTPALADLTQFVPADILEKLKGESFEVVTKGPDGTTYYSTNGAVLRRESLKP